MVNPQSLVNSLLLQGPGTIRSNTIKSLTSPDQAKEDENVEMATDELKTEVGKMKWQKHNFEEFDAGSIKGISSKFI